METEKLSNFPKVTQLECGNAGSKHRLSGSRAHTLRLPSTLKDYGGNYSLNSLIEGT